MNFNNNSFIWIIFILLFAQGGNCGDGSGLILILLLLMLQGGNCGICEAN